jgi:hypothetical protein
MAKITKIDPQDYEQAKLVQVDIEAQNNSEAVAELEEWAFEHGFARVRENFLRIISRPDGSRVFRGTCYKLTEEEKTAIDLNFKTIIQRADRIGDASKSGR